MIKSVKSMRWMLKYRRKTVNGGFQWSKYSNIFVVLFLMIHLHWKASSKYYKECLLGTTHRNYTSKIER